MSSPSLPPLTPDQRVLAAIVFTDVVSFSARMQEDETTTLRHLERDFITMREFSAMHGGTVIKTTGDGLLLYFTSAVHAVEWSLRTQRHFAEQARTYPPAEILRHRVGIHLGDVFRKGDDVMGDGVNIAARVQSEAPSGGICISQTVYDVVKNKSKLHVVRLEPRKLKNISENIQMYHLLLEPPQLAAPVTTTAATTAPVTPVRAPVREETTSGMPKVLLIFGVLAGLAAAGVFLVRAYFAHERDLAKSQTTQERLDAALKGKAAADGAAAGTAAGGPTAATGAATADEFDFVKLTGDRPAAAPRNAEEERLRQSADASIRMLEEWVFAGLARYTRDQPLLVRRLKSPSLGDLTLFTDAERQLHFAEGGAMRKRAWRDLTPDVQGAIALSLLRAGTNPPRREIVRGAEAFAYVHGLPEMARTLTRDRR